MVFLTSLRIKFCFETNAESSLKLTLSHVEDLASVADFILGHNLLGHDFPVLQSTYPQLAILKKPVIDTLYLSPLALPQNPYHRLVKDYKLVRSSVSDPVADARLAALVFRDQWASLKGTGAGAPQLIDFYRFCFEDSLFNGLSGEGLAAVFSAVGARGFESPGAALGFFVENTYGIVCRKAVVATVLPLLGDGARSPPWHIAWRGFRLPAPASCFSPGCATGFPKSPPF